jgi:hypothetical protein
MKRTLYTLAILALLSAACASQGEIVYTGENEDAREGSWIKDPEAEATTRDSGSRVDTTRTESNRIDIPVLEYAQVSATTYGAAAKRNSGYDARYTRIGFEAIRQLDFFEWDAEISGYSDRLTAEMLHANRNSTTFPGLYGDEQLNYRLGRDRLRAYSALETPWTDTMKLATEGIKSSAYAEGMRTEAYLEATRNRYGYDAAFASRVIGLHLWKYADRELVTDAVEITYTLVYYNTNDYDTGPTEIDEPVPYYTEYIEGSATLPKDGTSVEFIKRDNNRNLLRWKFPKGIEAGETNSMKYKVTVRLNAPPEYRPPEDRPSEPRKQ